MPEPDVFEVESYTNGRLASDDPATARLLATALAVARRYCGWHVTGIETTSVTLNGSGSPLLVLPTLRLLDVIFVLEDNIDADLRYVQASPRGLLTKRYGYTGGGVGLLWTSALAGVTVDMTHGFLDAPDWNSAVLSYIDRASQSVGGGERETVGPFSFAASATAAGSAFTEAERMLLDLYKLESLA
ncbi:hypothetical protein EB72_24780 [Mycobacterium sp. SWH-M1]|nr:hypothetical protein EB72_24780 [Mycobacterium sp. SWH-M1]